MKWKQEIAEYFRFSRRDRIAILTLLILIIVVLFLPEMVSKAHPSSFTEQDTAWVNAMQRLEYIESNDKKYADNETDHASYQYDRVVNNDDIRAKGELFYFDPNTCAEKDWKRLGLRERTIHTISNFLTKGGRFKKPEDLQRIYGLFPDEYERLAPFIRIVSDSYSDDKNQLANKMETNTSTQSRPSYSVIDINLADTTAWIALPGIGGKLASRIISFRDKLGGFYSIDQVGETYGLPDSTFQKIKLWLKRGTTMIKKININTATLDELKAHPYIRYALANPIIAYRNEHGDFATVTDLKKIMAITEDVFEKITPYLTTEK